MTSTRSTINKKEANMNFASLHGLPVRWGDFVCLTIFCFGTKFILFKPKLIFPKAEFLFTLLDVLLLDITIICKKAVYKVFRSLSFASKIDLFTIFDVNRSTSKVASNDATDFRCKTYSFVNSFSSFSLFFLESFLNSSISFIRLSAIFWP